MSQNRDDDIRLELAKLAWQFYFYFDKMGKWLQNGGEAVTKFHLSEEWLTIRSAGKIQYGACSSQVDSAYDAGLNVYRAMKTDIYP
ncbi:hypothetical protein EWH99_00055 [Sporolactobacillus sp. THM7-7]|nr:hypothetical protein EWH99_00055 [Sporolactobacillus sp. THM7-7]